MTNNRPLVFIPGKYSNQDIENLRKKVKIWREVDLYTKQLEELLQIKYPSNSDRRNQKKALLHDYSKTEGAWIYYPWNGILLHTVGSKELFELRTNRNHSIISTKEQKKLRNSSIAVVGMSVGAGIAIGSVYSGITNYIKLADFDQLETANLNRIREPLSNVGQAKVELAARTIFEIDPFINVQTFPKGITAANIDKLFESPKINIVVDAIDDFKMKIMLRIKAKENKVPLLMFTSLGDNILIDVERYDLSPQPELFNGAVGNVTEEILNSDNITPDDIKRYAVQLVGTEYIPTRALASLPEIGSTLVGRPQLYSTIAVDGGISAYIIRQLLLGANIKSGRHFIRFASLIGLKTDEFIDDKARTEILNLLMGHKK